MSKKIYKTITIPATYANTRLDHALVKLLADYSRTEINNWIKSGNILINNRLAKPSSKLKGGEVATLEIEIQKGIQDDLPQAISLNIVYEDDALIIINKPLGLVVHPGAGNRDKTLLNALLHYLPPLAYVPRAGILHRLDKDTTGLLIIAKTMNSYKFLSQQLKNRHIQREYQAVVHGLIISGGTIDAPLARHPMQRTKMSVVEGGRNAITHYRVLEKFRAHTLLKLQLETGRTHQIRAHLFHLRHPIVGDQTYKGRLKMAKGMNENTQAFLRHFKRQALHAFSLSLVHPVSQQMLSVSIDLPDDIRELIHILRRDKDDN